MYNTGYTVEMQKPSEFYSFFCGKYVGKFFEYYAYIALAGWVLVMISGSGATIKTYFEVPEFIGTILMGVLCAGAVCLGLKKLVNVLGFIGIVILIVTLALGGYIISTADVGVFEMHVSQYVAEGKILQPTVFGMKNAILSAFSYAGVLMFGCAAWVVSTGQMIKTKKQMVVTSVLSSLFYFTPLLAIIFIILLNVDTVVGTEIPLLVVVQNELPALALPYTFIIVAAIFTTAAGMLFVVVNRFAKDKTMKFYIITGGIVIFSVVVGTLIPFSTILNFIYSIMGMSGIILSVFMVAKFIILIKKREVPNRKTNNAPLN